MHYTTPAYARAIQRAANASMSLTGDPLLLMIAIKPSVRTIADSDITKPGARNEGLNSGRQKGIMPRMPPRMHNDISLKRFAIFVKWYFPMSATASPPLA